MQVTHVISSCIPGGAQVFVKSLPKQLYLEGNEVELWVMIKAKDIPYTNDQSICFEEKFIEELENTNIPVRFIWKRPNKDWYKTSKNLNKLFLQFRPDIVHSHSESGTFHICRALDTKVKIIQTIHSRKITQKFIRKFYINPRCSIFVAISNKVRIILEDNLKISPEKIKLIYNGIDTNDFLYENRNVKNKVKSIVSIGRFTKAKDCPNLLSAFSLLKSLLENERLDVPNLLLVGEGELRNQIKDEVKEKKLSENVKFLGVRNDIPEILKHSDIYVMSLQWEGLSISLIEALASGIPIVTTDAGSNNEIVENNVSGLIVPIKDPEVLANGLYKLIIDDQIWKKFSEEASKRAKLFTIEECAKKTC
ncbi:glycosyltransferase family 4 protein [Defluviitoga tunisiensis]|uniref:Glycosyltransferase n=1 Tax=Defluviitoga tunisiensis TaxID=1006576 RepID=A0A0C7NK94_DEFTU|nr:glycosyltransferase family 4 protein [Defluviitoga tunisiensis]CEP78296.1 glycosyltransferase [Defluviitoga tunisiensis]